MRTHSRTKLAAISIAAVAMFGLAACTTAAEEVTDDPAMEEEMDDTMSDPAFANLVGPGCTAYAEAVPDGAGSVVGMSQDPVAVAASNNPLLTTLVAAVSGQLNPEVNLVDVLNGDEFTVFAPVDDAFAALDAETVDALAQPENAELLTSILTYHVVPGQMLPADIAGMTLTTVNGQTLEIGSDVDTLTVNDANVICGGVMTANATVYLIDAVLLPAS